MEIKKKAVEGAVLGDIAGSWLEENRRFVVLKLGELDWKRFPRFTDECTFTDDTVMTLAIKKAIDEGRDLAEVMREVGRRYMDCGYGRTFYNWIKNGSSEPYGSYGNGSAMRVSYIGEYFNRLEEVQCWAEKSAAVSHDSEEGIKGAVTAASCIWLAEHGRDKEEILKYGMEMYPYGKYTYSPALKLDDMRDSYKWSVTCMDSLPLAIRCFYESEDYASFLTNVFSFDCDTDTIGAIGGGIAGAFYGTTYPDADNIIKKYLPEDLYEIYSR